MVGKLVWQMETAGHRVSEVSKQGRYVLWSHSPFYTTQDARTGGKATHYSQVFTLIIIIPEALPTGVSVSSN